MKRCPECRRDYYDETLIYCLDDGNALLGGPGSASGLKSGTGATGFTPNEPQTAILPDLDPVTDTLIGRLSQIPNLSVKSRSSVFRYKGTDVSPKKLGGDLAVQAVLNGRVNQRDGQVILNLELVDVRTENAIWSGQYARRQSDLVALQGEIARDVSDKLLVKLSGADEQRLARNYTENPEAYQLYLKARFHKGRLILPETQKAISYYEQAITLDPNYTLAYVGLARAYAGLALSSEMPPTETFLKAKAAAKKAVEMDPEMPDAIVAAGVTSFWFDWDWTESERGYKRALQLSSSSPEAFWAYSHLLSNLGRHEEALPLARRCTELDPLDLRTRSLEAQFLIHAGKVDEALARLKEVHDLDRDFWMAHLFASSAYIEKGMYQEAITTAQRAKELSPIQTTSVSMKGYALARSGRESEARAELSILLELSDRRFVPPYHIALIYHGLGETDRAFDWLERGYQVRDPKMTFLKVEPKWNSLRDDPRFQEMLRKVGFS